MVITSVWSRDRIPGEAVKGTLRESSICVVDMESRPDEEIVAIKQELHCNKTSAHMQPPHV